MHSFKTFINLLIDFAGEEVHIHFGSVFSLILQERRYISILDRSS